MSDVHSYFGHSIPLLHWDSVSRYVKRSFLSIGKYFKENQYYYTCNKPFFLFRNMLICPSDLFLGINVMLSGQVFFSKR